jgi:pyruvate decarboxylase
MNNKQVMSSTITLAEYLFTRIRQLGVQSVHGVPGDYNLELLEYLEPSLHWVGNCNELNAGYAADAYSRIKGLGVLITTFGVGELSATNAIAGAYAELAPVVHIVGTPARQLQESRALVHHTLNDGNYRHFADMSTHITVAQASLSDPRTCPLLIDSTIQQCLIHSRPVYIEVPTDMVSLPVSAERLQSKIEIPPKVSTQDEAAALLFVLDRIYSSERPMVLVDGESRAYNLLDELHRVVGMTGWPTWTTIFGKSLMKETLPNFYGIWKGKSASQEHQDFVKSRDLILCFGPHLSSTNTYDYSSIPDSAVSIFFTATSVKFSGQTFRDLPMKTFLSTLLGKLDQSKLKTIEDPTFPMDSKSLAIPRPPLDNPITQDHFYRTMSDFLRPGDIILAETGTAGHGCRDFKLPSHAYLFKPSTWLSIGYMLPAAQGAALAQRELHEAGKWNQDQTERIPRTILLLGDGSFQMTAQELSTIIREKLSVLIILINNAGYTIERCIHGWNQNYNDVASWKYLLAPAFFGANESEQSMYPSQTFQVKTWRDLLKAFADERLMYSPALKMIEVVMDRLDAPPTLLSLLHQQTLILEK